MEGKYKIKSTMYRCSVPLRLYFKAAWAGNLLAVHGGTSVSGSCRLFYVLFVSLSIINILFKR